MRTRAGSIHGFVECGEPALHLLSSRLADVKFGADPAQARDLAPGQVPADGCASAGCVRMHLGYCGFGLGY
jgi:hypothetical protein